MMRHTIIVSGAEGPLSEQTLSRRELARVCGYGSNPARANNIFVQC